MSGMEFVARPTLDHYSRRMWSSRSHFWRTGLRFRFLSTILLAATVLVSAAQNQSSKPPYSAGALEYLLERGEFDRFDWFITRYMKRHADDPLLYHLLSRRYFLEATEKPSHEIETWHDRTGGIPRKYPIPLIPNNLRNYTYSRIRYNDPLVHDAFEALRSARRLEPGRYDLYLELCRMAVESERIAILEAEIDTITSRFGCTKELVDLVMGYVSVKDARYSSPELSRLLERLASYCPEASELNIEAGRRFLARGEIDSALSSCRRAHRAVPEDPRPLRIGAGLFMVKADYRSAAKLFVKAGEIADGHMEFARAAICAFAVDTVIARDLWHKSMDEGVAEVPLFKEVLEGTAGNREDDRWFEGDNFYLNFPLSSIRLANSGDTLSFYGERAALFYACALYDSAQWCNLRQLRMMEPDSEQGYSALFNLAAEHYATGNHLLSYQRLRNLYKMPRARRDPAVHYALAVNHETCGNRSGARRHYRLAMYHSRGKQTNGYDIARLACDRLAEMENGALLPVDYR